jgi:hypothetical protein
MRLGQLLLAGSDTKAAPPEMDITYKSFDEESNCL